MFRTRSLAFFILAVAFIPSDGARIVRRTLTEQDLFEASPKRDKEVKGQALVKANEASRTTTSTTLRPASSTSPQPEPQQVKQRGLFAKVKDALSDAFKTAHEKVKQGITPVVEKVKQGITKAVQKVKDWADEKVISRYLGQDTENLPDVSLDNRVVLKAGMIRAGMVVTLAQDRLLCADMVERILCNRRKMGNTEKFEVGMDNSGRLFLIGGNQGSVCVKTGTRVSCNHGSVDGAASFEVEDAGQYLAVKHSQDNTYCGVGENNALHCSPKVTKQQAQFLVTCVQGCGEAPQMRAGVVITISKGGKLCSDHGDKVVCNSNTAGGWEKYEVSAVDASTGRVEVLGGNLGLSCALKRQGALGTGTNTDEDGDDLVACDRSKVNRSQGFFIEVDGPRVVLKAKQQGTYCGLDDSHAIRCNDKVQRADARFLVQCVEKCRPKGADLVPGMVVSFARGDKSVGLVCTAGLPEEGVKCIVPFGVTFHGAKFEVVDAGGGRIALKVDGRFCGVDDQGMSCNSKEIGERESFRFGTIGEQVVLKGGKDDKWCRVGKLNGQIHCDHNKKATLLHMTCLAHCSPAKARRIMSSAVVDLSSTPSNSFKLLVDIKTSQVSGCILSKVSKDADLQGSKWLCLHNGKLILRMQGNGALEGVTRVNDGQEHQVGFSWDGSKHRLFVDGMEDAHGLAKQVPDDPGSVLVVGRARAAGPDEQEFDGSVVDVTYNDKPVDLQAFAAFPGAPMDGTQLKRADVNLSSGPSTAFLLQAFVSVGGPDHGATDGQLLAKGSKVLRLEGGVVRFDLPGGSLEAVSRIDDGKLHEVGVAWDGHALSLQLDGRSEGERLTAIHVGDERGAPLEVVQGKKAQAEAAVVHSLMYNGKWVNLKA